MTKDIFQARNCLILDLDEESLPKNSKVHYLGYWCLENLSNSFKINNYVKTSKICV